METKRQDIRTLSNKIWQERVIHYYIHVNIWEGSHITYNRHV